MATTLTHRFSVSDYFRMAESGILPPDARVELIDGKVVGKAVQSPVHSFSASVLLHHFVPASDGRWSVSVHGPLDLGEFDMPEPDAMLLRHNECDYKSAHPVAADVFLLIEVSDSSLGYDRSVKLPLYAKHGIPEVWILNVPQRQLEAYRLPEADGYRERKILKSGQIAPAAFPDAGIEVGELV